MSAYDDTIEGLYAEASSLLDPAWRQSVREWIDCAEDMDAVEDLLKAAARENKPLPAGLIAAVETHLVPKAVRPPQDQAIRDTVAQLKAIAA